MKPIARSEVLGLADYATIRDRFRARVIAEKRLRRVALGPNASCVFENRDTVLMQIQEMLETERITREAAVLHEIETYNKLIPTEHELSATLFVEIHDKDERDRFLAEAKGLEHSFAVFVDGERCGGVHEKEREAEDRTTAVHYIKFPLGPVAERALRDVLEKKRAAKDLKIELAAEHARYTARVTLEPPLVQSLAEDFA